MQLQMTGLVSKMRDYNLGFYLGEWPVGVEKEKESRLSYRSDKGTQER